MKSNIVAESDEDMDYSDLFEQRLAALVDLFSGRLDVELARLFFASGAVFERELIEREGL
jgi:hypothetical protein